MLNSDREALEHMSIDSFTGSNRFLSNFWYCGVEFEGEDYISVEHAYQAAKTLDKIERWEIRRAKTPGQAKRLGKQVTLRADWDKVKLVVMRELLQSKFEDPVLARMLIETGDEWLSESNTWGDTFWGVCKGRGQNNLGRLLMELREDLRK